MNVQRQTQPDIKLLAVEIVSLIKNANRREILKRCSKKANSRRYGMLQLHLLQVCSTIY